MIDYNGMYARLCAWTARLGYGDEDVHGFAQRVCEAGFLGKTEAYPALLREYLKNRRNDEGGPALHSPPQEEQDRLV